MTYGSKMVLLLDNSFFDFVLEKEIDIGILEESLRTAFLNIVVTDKVFETGQERCWGVYKDLMKECRNNWQTLIEHFYKHDLEKFYSEHEKTLDLLKRALNCMGWTRVTKHHEDMDLLTSAILLKNNLMHPLIVSDDKDILVYSNLVFSYFGLCLRIFSTFELLSYLDKSKFGDNLRKYSDHYKLQLNIVTFEEEYPCEKLKTDISQGIRKGILSLHHNHE